MTVERILIVDDETMNRRLLEAILVAEGFAVVEAADGPAGLEIIATSKVDLVLLDVMMPQMSGFEVCRKIRADLHLPNLPVVFVTALGDRDSRIRAKDVGADEFLTKPVDDVELLVRVKSLLRLKAHHDAREKQHQLMSAILESMAEGVVAIDEASGLTLINAAAERILGPAAQWPDMTGWPGPNRVVSADGHVVEGGARAAPIAKALDGASTIDQRLLLGEEPGMHGRHLSVSATPLAAGTDARGAVAVFREVTELVELDRFKNEMTSLVVHDLKNIMVVIGTSLQYAAELAGEVHADLVTTLNDARDAAARAVRLVANLMDVARLENSRLALKLTPMETGAMCESALRHRVSQLRSRDVAVTLAADGAPPIRADLDLLQRVIDNVLDNAVRYTPTGGTIVIRAHGTPDGRVRIEIGNTGPVIPVEDRGRIFEKYGRSGPQTEESRGNAGLGLYFCRLAVAAHGGRIWVESTPELPTVFVVELPSCDVRAR
jgi:signal transduction histidine kinase/DNA-binding NarL/FixJ family response regulator